MIKSQAEERMLQNEVFFKKANQRVQAGFDDLKAIATEEKEPYSELYSHTAFDFFCECSDENCHKRLTLKLSEYNKAHHISEKCFVIAIGHDVPEIEDIVYKADDYVVVMKHKELPKHVDGLQSTPVDNTSV